MLHPIRGGFFILQLHDELLYEVAEDDVIQVQPCSSSFSSAVLLYFKQAFLLGALIVFLGSPPPWVLKGLCIQSPAE